MRREARFFSLSMWLVGTLVGSAEATAQQVESGGDIGTGARLSTLAGFGAVAGHRVTAVGGQLAIGQRLGPLTVELELDEVALFDRTRVGQRIGASERIGASARLDVATLGSSLLGPRSRFALWVEAGTGRQRAEFDDGDQLKRTDYHTGFGWLLDHRSRGSQRVPAVGWLVGWRFTYGAGPPGPTDSVCRSIACAPAAPVRELGFLVSSGLTARW